MSDTARVFEPVTFEMAFGLEQAIARTGIAAVMLIGFTARNADLAFGREVIGPYTHRIWDKSGYRYDISVGYGADYAASKSKEPDPFYFERKKELEKQ